MIKAEANCLKIYMCRCSSFFVTNKTRSKAFNVITDHYCLPAWDSQVLPSLDINMQCYTFVVNFFVVCVNILTRYAERTTHCHYLRLGAYFLWTCKKRICIEVRRQNRKIKIENKLIWAWQTNEKKARFNFLNYLKIRATTSDMKN